MLFSRSSPPAILLSTLLALVSLASPGWTKRSFDERFASAEQNRLANNNVEALREYTSLVKVRPGDSRMHANLGWVLLQLGRMKEGKEEIDKAMMLNDEDPSAHQAMAVYYMFNNDKKSARLEYIKTIALDPKRNCHCGGIQKYLGITPTDEKKAFNAAAKSGRAPTAASRLKIQIPAPQVMPPPTVVGPGK